MTIEKKFRWRLKSRELRLLGYLAIVGAFAAWKFIPRPWHPTVVLETSHYHIETTASREQAEEIGRVVEIQYLAYSNRFHVLPGYQRDHPKLKLLLYKDRDEMRRVNPGLGWAEAFYRKPYCRAYYSARELNPYHWMLHESVHQLNAEVAHLNLAKWLEEGLADYFATSRIQDGELAVGRIDPNTYPVWWIEDIATTPNLRTNVSNGSVIPLRVIITNRGGPSMSKEFNLYYLHWWTLTYFIFENKTNAESVLRLLEQGGNLDSFEKNFGPVENSEVEWHLFVRRIKMALSGNDLNFMQKGVLPPAQESP